MPREKISINEMIAEAIRSAVEEQLAARAQGEAAKAVKPAAPVVLVKVARQGKAKEEAPAAAQGAAAPAVSSAVAAGVVAKSTAPASSASAATESTSTGVAVAAGAAASPPAATTATATPAAPATPTPAASAKSSSNDVIDRVRAELRAAYDGRPVSPDRLAFRLKADRDLVDAALMYLVSRKEAKSMGARGKIGYVPMRPR